MLLVFLLPTLVFSCGDVCNENDDAYTPDKVYSVAATPTCGTGYKSFLRPGYTWCLRVAPAVGMTYAQAQAVCAADGAVASGFYNVDEWHWAAARGLANIGTTVAQGAIWLGLQLRPSCNFANFYELPACTPTTTKAYYWTDGYTTGYDTISWDGTGPVEIPYQCAFMVVYRGISYSSIYSTQTMNYNCSITNPEYAYEYAQGVLCGKLPTTTE